MNNDTWSEAIIEDVKDVWNKLHGIWYKALLLAGVLWTIGGVVATLLSLLYGYLPGVLLILIYAGVYMFMKKVSEHTNSTGEPIDNMWHWD